MSTGIVERVYQLTKVSSGDWLLPSNDGNTVWRICQYLEEVNGKHYWGFAKYDRPLVGEFWQDPDFLDWGDQWLWWSSGYRTRKEAIEAALRSES